MYYYKITNNGTIIGYESRSVKINSPTHTEITKEEYEAEIEMWVENE